MSGFKRQYLVTIKEDEDDSEYANPDDVLTILEGYYRNVKVKAVEA